jgi:hypothetical protein
VKNSKLLIAGVLVAAGASSAAQAVFVSFASDTNPSGPTFRGLPTVAGGLGRIQDGNPVQVLLTVDLDEDGPAGPIVIPAEFDADFAVTTHFLAANVHVYTLIGSFELRDTATNTLLLGATFNNGAFTSVGTAEALGDSGTLQGNSSAGVASLIFTTGGIFAGFDPSLGSRSFGFSMTNLFGQGGGPASVAANGAFVVPFTSEGSFSARFIPAPGGVALAGLMALGAGRRRR